MTRATNNPATHKRRVRRMKAARGYYGGRSKRFRQATEVVDRAMALSYVGRKEKKRDFRALWIVRLSAACKANGISYSRFIEGLKKAGIALNRKMLSEIAIHDADGFKAIAETAKAHATLPAKA